MAQRRSALAIALVATDLVAAPVAVAALALVATLALSFTLPVAELLALVVAVAAFAFKTFATVPPIALLACGRAHGGCGRFRGRGVGLAEVTAGAAAAMPLALLSASGLVTVGGLALGGRGTFLWLIL